ncbi:hypothetical protein C0J52_02514 [Blattella germanica]|nr:hypothetical protein C0J52_02514 [Blattella germanica]
MDLQFKQSRDIANWLGEEEVEEDINDESSGEEDCVLESDHETDTEQEGDSDEDNVPLCQREVYKGKDGTQWNKAVPPKKILERFPIVNKRIDHKCYYKFITF